MILQFLVTQMSCGAYICSMRVLSIALAVVISTLAAATSHADERRIATLAPEGSRWMKQLRAGADKIEKATNGRVTAKYYAGGTQGDEKDVVRKMGLGQLDGAALTSVGLGLIVPSIRVLQLPGLYANVGEVDYVRKKMWPYFQKKFRKQGYELLAPGDVGWIYMFATKSVKSEAALKRLKIWRWGDDPMSAEVFKELGLNGVPLGVPEVNAAFATGRVDAAFGSPLAAIALQWHTSVKYMSSIPIGYGVGGMVLRKKVWDAASDTDKKIQTKIGRKQVKRSIKLIRKDNKRALKALKREGITFVTPDDSLQKKLAGTAEKTWTRWVGDLYTKKELAMVLKYRDEYRAKHPVKEGAVGEIAK